MATANSTRRLSPPEAAQFLGVKLNTLGIWRCTKRHPLNFLKVGRKIYYLLDDLEKFQESRTTYVRIGG